MADEADLSDETQTEQHDEKPTPIALPPDLRDRAAHHADDLTLDELEQIALAATPGPWGSCGPRCSCTAVMCNDYPVAAVTKGDWGDDYPNIRIEGGSLDARAVAFMDQITYGSVHLDRAMANRAHIAAANPKTVLALIARLRAAEAGTSLDAGRAGAEGEGKL